MICLQDIAAKIAVKAAAAGGLPDSCTQFGTYGELMQNMKVARKKDLLHFVLMRCNVNMTQGFSTENCVVNFW